MKHLILAICLVAFLGSPAIADDPVPKPAPVADVSDDGPTPDWVDAPVVEPGSNEDLTQKLGEAKQRLEDLRGAEDGKMLLVFLLLAAICNVLLSGIKRWRKFSDKGKKYLPWVATGLGVAVGFLAYAGTGAGILEAFLYGAGPPFAVLIQELFGPIKSKTSD